MQKYRLSNRQQKELVIRGQELKIVVPIGDHDVDLSQYVRQSIPELPSEVDLSCEIVNQPVALPPISDDPSLTSSVLGVVLDGRDLQNQQVAISVRCCLVTITPPRCRGRLNRTQWPGVLLD